MTDLKGCDISNLQGPPEVYRDEPWYQAAEFVIVQALRPPYPYRGWDVGGYTEAQLRAAVADGKRVGIYVWLWDAFSGDGLRADIAARLALVPDDLHLDMRPWLDVEDTTEASVADRHDDVQVALEVMDAWAAARGLPAAGVYTGQWYINGSTYLDGWFPDGRCEWLADYSHAPTLSPERPLWQYTSTPVDSDVMLESEVVTVTDDERQQYQDRIDGLVSALGLIAGDVVKPLRRKTAAAYVRNAVARIDSVADQFGVAHGG